MTEELLSDEPLEILPGELRARLKDVQLVDVREPWEVETAKIEGSIDIPMQQIPDSLDKLDAGRPLVVMCHHGGRSLMVTQWLRQNGFLRAQNLVGGIDVWAQEIDPSIGRY